MDQYKISQNPGSKKKPAKKTSSAPKRRQSKSLNPQLVMGGVVIALVLVLGGFVWARYFNKSSDTPATKSGASANSNGQSQDTVTAVPEATFNDVTAAISNKKPSDLKKYYAKRVKIIILKTNINQSVTAAQVENLISNPLNNAQTPWNWHPSVEDLAAWQSGPYGQYFGDNTIVGISPDGTVISIHIDENGQIDTVFIAPVGDLTSPTPGGSADGSVPTSDTTPSSGDSAPTEDAD